MGGRVGPGPHAHLAGHGNRNGTGGGGVEAVGRLVCGDGGGGDREQRGE